MAKKTHKVQTWVFEAIGKQKQRFLKDAFFS